MTPDDNDTECPANISGSENYIYICMYYSLLIENYTNLFALPLRDLAIWDSTFGLSSKCLIYFPLSSIFYLFLPFPPFPFYILFHLYLSLF